MEEKVIIDIERNAIYGKCLKKNLKNQFIQLKEIIENVP